MSEPIKLGKLITDTQYRDAIHVAIVPVSSKSYLSPGEHVSLVSGSTTEVTDSNNEKIGIVDPFLRKSPKPSEKFWLLLYPQTVTAIRHHWTHPAFQDLPVAHNAQDWITQFAARWEYSYDEFMAAAHEYVKKFHTLDDKWMSVEVSSEDWAIFWDHFHTLTGVTIEGREKEFVVCCPN